MAEYQSVADLLGSMMGHGVYAIGIVSELTPFGFTFDGKILRYDGRTWPLYSATRQQKVIEMGGDKSGGMLDDVPDDLLLIDALDLSVAVHYLLTGKDRAPSDGYTGRAYGFRANVRAIERIERERKLDA